MVNAIDSAINHRLKCSFRVLKYINIISLITGAGSAHIYTMKCKGMDIKSITPSKEHGQKKKGKEKFNKGRILIRFMG